MAKMVGLSRSVKLEWLNKTAELVMQNKSEQEIKAELNEYLSYEIGSATVLRKTREILLNTWVRIPHATIKKQALQTLDGDKKNWLVVHWCLLLLAYPVFGDVCGLIGKLTKMQDEFTTKWLQEKLYELWGERNTLFHSSAKILQTIKCLGAVDNTKPGVYSVRHFPVNDPEAITMILMTILQLQNKAYYEIAELSVVPQMFPFSYSISHEWLHASQSFSLNNFGGKVVLSGE